VAATLAVGIPVAVTTRAHHTAERPMATISPAPHPAARLVIEPVRLTQPVLIRTSTPTPIARPIGHRESESNGGGSGKDGERAARGDGEDKLSGGGADGPSAQADGGTHGAPAPPVTGGGDSGSGSGDGGSSDGGSSQGGN
jgi:hypothetical protein